MPALVALDPSCAWDPNIDRVATTALLRLPREQREYGGILYKNAQGEYCYSTYAPGAKDNFELRGQLPKGSSLAGTYHNHPGVGNSYDHSPNDIAVAKALDVPSYIRVDVEGSNIRKLAPGSKQNSLLPPPSPPLARTAP